MANKSYSREENGLGERQHESVRIIIAFDLTRLARNLACRPTLFLTVVTTLNIIRERTCPSASEIILNHPLMVTLEKHDVDERQP